jgi:bacteriocin biosynthesis cyclodehydratase domain-containing protein
VLRLRPDLEIFPAGDGVVLLIRDSLTAEYEIEDADESSLALLDLLRRPRTPEELATELERRGTPVRNLPEALAQLGELGVLVPAGPTHADARHERQLAYFDAVRPGSAAAMQRALAHATVAIVGLGGLGTWAASALAGAGVGHLVLVDDDVVELGNLNRQVLYRHADLGRAKVEVAVDALTALDPALRLTARRERVDGPAAARDVTTGAGFVVETADWPPYELSRWLDAACQEQAIPRITAAQFPPRIRIGPAYLPGITGCLECQERATRREYPLYDRLAAHRRDHPTPAATLGPASGIIGAALAMEVVHHLTGIALPATAGAAVTIDLRDWSIERTAVERDPGCPRCGSWADVPPGTSA